MRAYNMRVAATEQRIRQSAKHERKGVSGAAGHTGLVGRAVYGTWKRPLALLTSRGPRSTAPRGVNVDELASGLVRAPGADPMEEGFVEVIATVPVKRAAAPDEIPAAAVYLASEYADYVHGTTLTVDRGRLAV